MNFIPIVIKPLPDELLYSWIHRLADANGLLIKNFQEAYMDSKSPKIGTLKLDVGSEFVGLCKSIRYQIDMKELYMELSTFQFESFFMTPGQQMRQVLNVFGPKNRLNTAINGIINDIKICPECLKEDNIPYIHRAHQLSGICTCYKHGCKLSVYTGAKGHAMEFMDFKEIETDISLDSLVAYTDYAQKLFALGIDSNIKVIRDVLYAALKEHNYSVADHYESLIQDIAKWKYHDLLIVDICSFLKTKMIMAEYVTAQELIPFFMFLYPNPEELAALIAMNIPVIQSFKCPDCGTQYIGTPLSHEEGWTCPDCMQNESEQDIFLRLVDKTGRGNYKLLTAFDGASTPVGMHHDRCDRDIRIKPRDFLFENVRCQCEQMIIERDIKEIVEASGEFEVLKFTNTSKPVLILHKKCGQAYKYRYDHFIENPQCKLCNSLIGNSMTPDLYEKRIINLVGDEYTLIKGFINQETKVVLRHIECGEEQEYWPSTFLDGQRCKKCHKMIRHSELERVLKEYSNDRYKIIHYGCNLCTVLDEKNSKEIMLSPLKVLQEIVRPTPSELLPIDNWQQRKYDIRSNWDRGFECFNEYKKEFGHTNIPKRCVYKEYNLGTWCQHQRKEYQNGKLREDRFLCLEKEGFEFGPLDAEWERRYEQYKRYIAETGSTKITRRTDFEGEHLGTWVETQRKRHAIGKVSKERIDKLEALDDKFFERNYIC